MIILDTNVLGELVRPEADNNVVEWLDRQSAEDLATTAITAAEMAWGVAKLPAGRRRSDIARLNAAVLERLAAVLPFSASDASNYGSILGARRRSGREIKPLDAQIAAISLSHGAALATRNTKDFEGCGVKLINPWTA